MKNWRSLFETYPVSRQIFPHLDETQKNNYSVHNAEITQELVDAGIVFRPRPKNFYHEQDFWAEAAKNILEIDNKQHVILPHSEFPDQDSFSRKDDYLLPVRFNPDKPLSVLERLSQAMSDVTLLQTLVGYDFQGIHHTSRQYRTTTLTDCIRGVMITNASVVSHQNIVFLSYRSLEVKDHGANASVEKIPSIDSRRKHEVPIERIAIYTPEWGESNDAKKLLVQGTYQLESSHSCRRIDRKSGFSRATRTGERYGTEMELDYHTIVAFNVVKKALEAKNIVVASPFYIPTQDDFRLFRKLHRNVLMEYQSNSGNVTRQPLKLNEMEIMLWKTIAYKNQASN